MDAALSLLLHSYVVFYLQTCEVGPPRFTTYSPLDCDYHESLENYTPTGLNARLIHIVDSKQNGQYEVETIPDLGCRGHHRLGALVLDFATS
ncbi:hypothetical protein N7450_002619 [Penicillium hetheringtonii]|uniref:Uncharacterized protein n=1 Tax=Penicillium hetheringtonii TaxID=911720 RepID=A0AAD6DWG2_9EURO|nr:hypothetical protein N7450_002619 [Penicillium hetheringtonii]